ncbi:MAG: VWA domain-containing protein [Bacteroidales bacterium]|jgi:hypothetical protein|nr:VWA domain-containing protein [Bacteroidales bacterium]
MNDIVQFFLKFGQYAKETDILWAVLTPVITLAAIWLLTFVGLKIFDKTGRLRKVFMIHRTLIVVSLLIALILVSIICYCWSKNLFDASHLELAFIISLMIAFIVPIISFAVLRSYWEKTKVNEITSQPISAEQARNNIPFINKAFNKNKIYYLLPLIGFLFLLFSLNKGTNLISLVFDNSGSMDVTNSYNALDKTFSKLGDNNEIIITTLNGLPDTWVPNSGIPVKEIMNTKTSSKLKAGRNYAFNNPGEAKNALNSILTPDEPVNGSPICEAIWKMWLFTKESKGNTNYKNKLLILISDGDENYAKIDSFFYDDTEFAEYYTPENTHIVDYSTDGDGIVIKKFEESGATIYPAVTSVDDYLSALDDALLSFQNNIYLIAWTIVICVLGTIIGLVITPKKITI